MWSGASCTYASLQYQCVTAVALSAGQYIGVARGEYIHLTLGGDKTDTQVTERIDQMFSQKMLQETGDDTAFQTRMRAGKQLGADMMTERVIREIDQEKLLLAEPEPINVADWDEAIMTELGRSNDDMTPRDLQPQMDTMDMDRHLDKQPTDTGLPKPAHSQPTPQAQKTNAHNKTPQKKPQKDDTATKKEDGDTGIPTAQQENGRDGRIHRSHQTQRRREGTVKKPTGQRKKVRCLFLMPFVAVMAPHLLLAPPHIWKDQYSCSL